MSTAVMEAYWTVEQKIVPGLRYSQYAYEEVLDRLVVSGTRWLDVGCGHHILPEWCLESELPLVERAGCVVGVDPTVQPGHSHRSIRDVRVGTAQQLPFEAASFDLVTANMVVEHLTDPEASFQEIFRVLRPGGKFLLHTPNLHGYVAGLARLLPSAVKRTLATALEDRKAEDVYPTHYRCNTEATLRRIAQRGRFAVVSVRHIPTSAAFARVLPLAIVELFWIKITMSERCSRLRTNIIAILERPE